MIRVDQGTRASESKRGTAIDVSAMYEIAAETLQERLYELPAEELLQEEDVEKDAAGRVVGVRPLYELRSFKIRYPHVSVVGAGITRGFFALQILTSIDDNLKALAAQQPTGDWRVVAAMIRRIEQPLVTVIPYRGEVVSMHVAESRQDLARHAGSNLMRPLAVDRRTDSHLRDEITMVIEIAVADVLRAELTDPNLAHGGRGPMTTYVERRQLRFLPNGLRSDREAAKLIVLATVGGALPEQEAEAPRRKPKPRDNDELVQREFTPEEENEMVSMRLSGQPPKVIADKFKTSWQRVNAVVTKAVAGDSAAQGE